LTSNRKIPRDEEEDNQDEEAIASPIIEHTGPHHRRKSLMPANKVFDKTLLLRIWRSHRHELHAAMQGLRTDVRQGDKGGGSSAPPQASPVDRGRGGRLGGRRDDVPDRSSFGVDMSKNMGGKGKKESLLKTSEKGYKVQETKSLTRQEKIQREVKSLLNKIAPDNLKTIVDRLANIELYTAEELEFVIRIIFGKALLEPHYCETYADMVFALKNRYPEFPPENEGEKPQTFTRVLLNTCQNEFESLPTTFEATQEEREQLSAEDLQLELHKRKQKMLANMKFIGHLFLRNLLAVKVIGQVVHDLVGIKEQLPEEHMIECVCELLQAIGHTLDSTASGKDLMAKFAARLQDLKRSQGPDNNTAAYSKRVQFLIQGLLELRGKGWTKKLFKEQAATKEEVRRNAMAEGRKMAKGAGTDAMFTTQVVGMRPQYLNEVANQAKNGGSSQKKGTESNITWDQKYVLKIAQYFSDDKNVEELCENWKKGKASHEQTKQGVEWVLDHGINFPGKEEAMTEVLVSLLRGRAISWQHLTDSLTPYLEGLEDMKMDVPTVDIFVQCLLSKLMEKYQKDFNAALIKPLADQGASDFNWRVYCGTFKRLSPPAVSALMEHRELVSMIGKAKKIDTAHALRRALQQDHAI